MIYPKSLENGDSIAIVSPASKIDGALIDGACRTIESWGFRPVLGEFCKGEYGSFSGSVDQRLRDFKRAFEDEDVRAVLCSRGGYGTVQLLEYFQLNMWKNDPKWLIGFSDISVLHAASFHAGVASLHGSMCKCLAEQPDSESSRRIRDILTGGLPEYLVQGNTCNREGKAEGVISGGNLAVLSGIVSTPYNLLKKGNILFIEDVAEPIYKVERMLYTLRLNGTLEQIKGLIVGQFTEYKASQDYTDMYDMIEDMVSGYNFPVAYNFPVGHVDRNLPIIEGAEVELEVGRQEVRLKFIDNRR